MSNQVKSGFFLLRLILSSIPTLLIGTTQANASLSPTDYEKLWRFDELALSPDGNKVATLVSSNERGAELWILDAATGKRLRTLPAFQGRSIQWLPNSSVAYLARVGPYDQVFNIGLFAASGLQVTKVPFGVSAYEYAPNGRTLAFITSLHASLPSRLYQELNQGGKGVVVDPRHVGIYDLINPTWGQIPSRVSIRHVVALQSGSRVRTFTKVAGDVQEIHWSPTGGRLSVVFVEDGMPASELRRFRTSVGIVDTGTGSFKLVAEGRSPTNHSAGFRFSGGEWSPDGKEILLERVIESHPWFSALFPDLALIQVDQAHDVHTATWLASQTYGRSRYWLEGKSSFLMETVRRARTVLIRRTSQLGGEEVLLPGLDGSVSDFSFSRSLRDAVLVHESLTDPPELFLWRHSRHLRQLTDVNQAIRRRIGFSKQLIAWRSADGTHVEGWLLTPIDKSKSSARPTITFLHGGPAFPYRDAFAPYYFHAWPYPIELYVESGMNVFIPNYRGTASYGKGFIPRVIDEEQVDDVVTGIEMLIKTGIAQANRLGISGQSWGAWLGPLIVTKYPHFTAASFAEGSPDPFLSASLNEGAFIDDDVKIWGTTIYQNPDRYLHAAAEFGLGESPTALLLEAGSWGNAPYMLSYGNAAQYHGLPVELVIYPRTAHNLTDPAMIRESASRNLDWFRFWLQDREDQGQLKEEQYRRWRQLRELRTALSSVVH